MGCLGGYESARFYKLFGHSNGKDVTLMTALALPGIIFSVFFILNLCIWEEKSAGAVPFTTLLALLVLWFGISVPLVFLGAHCTSALAGKFRKTHSCQNMKPPSESA